MSPRINKSTVRVRQCNKHCIMLLVIFTVFVGLLNVPDTMANVRHGSEVNPADLQDPFAFGVNPSLDEMAVSQIAAGFQVLHWGLLEGAADLNTGGLIWTKRKPYGGLSLGVSYLTTPLWGERQFQAGFGRRIIAGLSLGVSLGLNQRSFNEKRFNVTSGSSSDPLLSGSLARTVPTTAFSAAYSLPLEGLTAALVLENAHEPNVSIGGNDPGVFLPRTWRSGISWERELWQVTANVVDDNLRTRYGAAVRGTILGGHGLLARLETDQWVLGARIGVMPKAWVEYTYTNPRSELSEVAAGTHGIVICLHAGSRVEPEIFFTHQQVDDRSYNSGVKGTGPAQLPLASPVQIAAPALASGILTVVAEADTALIRVKRIRRTFKQGVDMAQVRRLPRWRIGVLDSTWSDRITWSVTEGMKPAHPESELPRGNYSDEYRAGMMALQGGLSQDNQPKLIIAADRSQLDRAKYLASKVAGDSLTAGQIEIRELAPIGNETLRRVLQKPVGPDSIPAVEEVTLYQYARIPFRISTLGSAEKIKSWSFEIRDSGNQPVRLMSGIGSPPPVLGWDWRNTQGMIVDVDSYTYQLSWQDTDGNVAHAPKREILIARQIMQRTLDFGRDQKPLRSMKDTSPVLILDPGREGLSIGTASKDEIKTGGIE